MAATVDSFMILLDPLLKTVFTIRQSLLLSHLSSFLTFSRFVKALTRGSGFVENDANSVVFLHTYHVSTFYIYLVYDLLTQWYEPSFKNINFLLGFLADD